MTSAKNDAKTTTQARDDDWLPIQRVLRAYKESGQSLTALGKKAGVNDSMLSRATTIPGRDLDEDTLQRLLPHVEGLREAIAEQMQMKMAASAARLGIALPGAGAPVPQDGRTMLPFREIFQSKKLNPRKIFEPEAIAELAESIAIYGVLQNLTVRPLGPGRYELTAGERRWRAIGLLVEQGRWDRDAVNIPVHILDVDEGKARAIALLENLQRVEISPLEEADAFAELRALNPDEWTTDAIARAIGKEGESGQRYVLQRLALADRLVPDARELLRDKRITFEKARYLTQFKPDVQDQVVTELERGDPDLNSLFEHFRERVQAIASALAPKDEKPIRAAAGTQQEPAYRGTIAAPEAASPSGDVPPPVTVPVTDHDPKDIEIGLPDPETWTLETSTPRLQTITLMAPTAEAFEAALRLFKPRADGRVQSDAA